MIFLDIMVLLNVGILTAMIISIIVSGWLSRKSITQTRESIEDNRKTQSAYISLQLLDKIREDKFKEINNKIIT